MRVYRPPDEVFDPASLASFAGKPVTLDHPPAMVDSGNWKSFAVGHSGAAVARDGDHLATDLVITDAPAVAKAEQGSELSNGYWADFDFTPGLTPDGEPYDAVQRNIRGNHIALVDQGRCGPSCAGVTAGSDAAATISADAAITTSAPVLDCSPGEAAVELSRLRSDIAAREGEIAALKARAAADAASLDRRAAERSTTIEVARSLLGAGFDPTGLDIGDIRRAAVVKAVGQDAVRGRSDDYVAAAFDTVAALGAEPRPLLGSRTTNPLAGHLAAGSVRGGSQDTALQDRNAYLAAAWKPDLHPRRPLMPAVQTSYATFQSAAFLGMMANGEWVTNVVSRVVDPAAAVPVNFGDPVVQGASEQTVVSANGGTGVFRGIAIRDATLPPTASDQYAATMTVGVVTKGVVWVNATVAVSPGQPAFFTPAGLLTNVATGNTAIAGALWESATAGIGLAKLRLA